jgi:hypothetical protein
MPSKKRKKKAPLHKRIYSQLGGLKLQGKVKASRKSVLVAALVVLVMGAGVYKLSSHAGSAPTYLHGSHDFGWGLESYYTSTFTTSDGWICVSTNFNSSIWPKPNYKWYVQKYAYGQWNDVRTSNEFSANGNTDRSCWSYEGGNGVRFVKGTYYRIRFKPINSWVAGPWRVSGYYNNNL